MMIHTGYWYGFKSFEIFTYINQSDQMKNEVFIVRCAYILKKLLEHSVQSTLAPPYLANKKQTIFVRYILPRFIVKYQVAMVR